MHTLLFDAGVPMIFPALPVMLASLLPIIGIEALVLRQLLPTSLSVAAKASAIANVASTLLGIPITWFLLVALQLLTGGGRAYGLTTPLDKIAAVTWQSPWLIPYESDLYWMIPTAGLVLLVPFFFASWFVEYMIERRLLKEFEARKIRRAVMYANLASYALLAGYLIFAIVTSKRPTYDVHAL